MDAGLTPDGEPRKPRRFRQVQAIWNFHHVPDEWVQSAWRPKEARVGMIIVRYADGFVLGFLDRSDAERFQRNATVRLAGHGLDLRAGRTRLLEFGRLAEANRKRGEQGRPEAFDFLALSHGCRRTRHGRF